MPWTPLSRIITQSLSAVCLLLVVNSAYASGSTSPSQYDPLSALLGTPSTTPDNRSTQRTRGYISTSEYNTDTVKHWLIQMKQREFATPIRPPIEQPFQARLFAVKVDNDCLTAQCLTPKVEALSDVIYDHFTTHLRMHKRPIDHALPKHTHRFSHTDDNITRFAYMKRRGQPSYIKHTFVTVQFSDRVVVDDVHFIVAKPDIRPIQEKPTR